MDGDDNASNVKVAVRCRPLNSKELSAGGTSCFRVEDGAKVVLTQPTDGSVYEFIYDHMYDESASQEQVYLDNGAPLLDKAFAGFNGTIFAYGQTGSGKTHCMSGSGTSPDMQGIIPRMNREIFARINREKESHPTRQFLVECSYFEVYNEIIYDLLDATRKAPGKGGHTGAGLEVKEDKARGIYVKGLKEVVVADAAGLETLMAAGNSMRTQAATNMNERSSRSHSIFTIRLRQRDTADTGHNLFAKINLVDLAGSERQSKTGATGSRLKEGANINKSLSELGNVINKLAELGKAQGKGKKKVFIPYRNSKLTRVLQESLGGNSLTCMLATLSPAASNFQETLTTLRYADRAKAIPVHATKNDESEQVEKLNSEIAALKAKLAEQAGGVSRQQTKELEAKYLSQIAEIESSMKQTWEEKSKLSEQYEEERRRLMEAGAKEQARLKSQMEADKRRRWRMLEEKGDVELAVRELYGWDASDGPMLTLPGHARKTSLQSVSILSPSIGTTGNSLPVPQGADLGQWVAMYRSSLAHAENVKEQSNMASVYRDSVAADCSRLATTGVAATQEGYTAARSTLEQTRSKLDTLAAEVTTVMTTRDKALGDLKALRESVTVVKDALQEQVDSDAAKAPSRPKPAIALVAPESPASGGAGGAAAGAGGPAPSPPPSRRTASQQELDAVQLLLRVIAAHEASVSKQVSDASKVFNIRSSVAPLLPLVQSDLAKPLPEGSEPQQDASAAAGTSSAGGHSQASHAPGPPSQAGIEAAIAQLRSSTSGPRGSPRKSMASQRSRTPRLSAASLPEPKPPQEPDEGDASIKSADTLLHGLYHRLGLRLEALLKAVVAAKASDADKISSLETRVDELTSQVTELERALDASDAALQKERNGSASLRQRVTGLSTELEMVKAKHSSTAEDATAASSKVVQLTQKVGQLEELLATTQADSETAHTKLKDLDAKLSSLKQESSARIASLTERLQKSEAEAALQTKLKEETSAALATAQSKANDIETSNLRMKARLEKLEEREKSLTLELESKSAELVTTQTSYEQAVTELEASKEAVADLTSRVAVAEDERDAARQKEEEYYEENKDLEEQLERAQEGYVELSDRLNDKMDEAFELQNELESAKASALEWQRHAYTTMGTSATPRGSAADAIPVRRAESTARSVLSKVYCILAAGMQQPDALPSSEARSARGVTSPSAALASARSPGAEDDYEEDFEEEEEEEGEEDRFAASKPSTSNSSRPLHSGGSSTSMSTSMGRVGAGTAVLPALSMPPQPKLLTTEEFNDLELSELSDKMEVFVKSLVDRIAWDNQQIQMLTAKVRALEARLAILPRKR